MDTLSFYSQGNRGIKFTKNDKFWVTENEVSLKTEHQVMCPASLNKSLTRWKAKSSPFAESCSVQKLDHSARSTKHWNSFYFWKRAIDFCIKCETF